MTRRNDERPGWRGRGGSQPHRRPGIVSAAKTPYYVIFKQGSTRPLGNGFPGICSISGSSRWTHRSALQARQGDPGHGDLAAEADCDILSRAGGPAPGNCLRRWPRRPRSGNPLVTATDPGAEDDLRLLTLRWRVRQVDIPEGPRFPGLTHQFSQHAGRPARARCQSITLPLAM